MGRFGQKAFWAVLGAALLASGCANRPMHRADIQDLRGMRIVRVSTPALEVPTFMQEAVGRGIMGGALPHAIAAGDPKLTLRPPEIIDATKAFVDAFQRQLPSRAPWWPAGDDLGEAVPANYVHRGSPWLRVEITRYGIAPSPLRTLHIVVHFSLRPAGAMDDSSPYWSKVASYSGAVHGGERLAHTDADQINRAIRHGAEWLADQVLSAMTQAADVSRGAPRTTAGAATGSSVAADAPRAAPVPGRVSPAPVLATGDYTGSLRCGAFEGPGRVDFPGPWVAPVRVSVRGASASMERADDKYSESLTGRLVGNSMTLEGRGAMHATPAAYWVTRVSGQFLQEGRRFDGSAQLLDSRGNVFRRCTVDLTAAGGASGG